MLNKLKNWFRKPESAKELSTEKMVINLWQRVGELERRIDMQNEWQTVDKSSFEKEAEKNGFKRKGYLDV